MERKIVFSEGEFYHLYNRGVEKRTIFSDNNDRERFLKLLFIANSTEPFVFRDVDNKKLSEIDREELLTAIGAYCLMPNHFHILVKEVKKGGVSAFMEKLTTGYSMYFNKRNDRVGPLFQGTFKAQHIVRDEHLKYLYAYIHLNPVKLIDSRWKESGIRDRTHAKHYLQEYRYSSYLDYCGAKREEELILAPDEFPRYFSKSYSFNNLINDWLSYSDQNSINT